MTSVQKKSSDISLQFATTRRDYRRSVKKPPGPPERRAPEKLLLSSAMDKPELLAVRRAVLDALAFLETLRRGPDGEHGNGGHDLERVEKVAQDVTEGLQAAAELLGREITG